MEFARNAAEWVYAAKLLTEGKTYNQVISQADISSATLSRVSRRVQYGNGYSKFLKKLQKGRLFSRPNIFIVSQRQNTVNDFLSKSSCFSHLHDLERTFL